MDIRRRCFLISFVCAAFSFNGFGTDVLTYHNDNAHTGWNPNEVVLTPSNVKATSFGLMLNLPVDGKVDAQPLYVSNTPVTRLKINQRNADVSIPQSTANGNAVKARERPYAG
jgi:hypothetical protein